MSKIPDATRDAAGDLAENLAGLATVIANRLRGDDPVPPIAVGKALVALDKMQGQLQRHADRMRPPESKK